MRWIWIDRIVAFEPGRRASAVKAITGEEDCLSDHFPGFPVMPPCLLIEGMAQTAGILVGEARQFQWNVVLAKVRRAAFTDVAIPGDNVRFDAEIEALDERAGITTGVIGKNGTTIGLVDLIFSYLVPATATEGMPVDNFVFTGPFLDLLTSFQGSNRGA